MDTLGELLTIADVEPMSTGQALDLIGTLADLADEAGSEDGLKKALAWCSQLETRQMDASHLGILYYFKANIFAYLRQLRDSDRKRTWDWESTETEQVITCLRMALRSVGPSTSEPIRLCQMLTNLGNELSQVGRFIEALDYWDRAVAVIPSFGMAIGNRAEGLLYYASVLYDAGHRGVFSSVAYRQLKLALAQILEGDARRGFTQMKSWIEKNIPEGFLANPTRLEGYDMGDSFEERDYRTWCLRERLFLNPLNDLGPHEIASRDVLTCPGIIAPAGKGPVFHAFYNQLKQEYVSARWLLFECMTTTSTRFSDRDVYLYNTLDYPVYGLRWEKGRMAIRMAYSLFDKVAFYLNSYLGLGIPERSVAFRSLWYVKGQRDKGLCEEFRQRTNWPLRGLFWLSKDLFYPQFNDAIEPESCQLHTVRNHLEHKYLKLHDCWWGGSSDQADARECAFQDDLAFSVRTEDFLDYGVRVLKLSRAALMYLSLAIHVEEQAKAQTLHPGQIVAQSLGEFDDSWKR